MQKTTFKITKMDCPSEEQVIRMRLDGLENIRSLEFDIPNRLLHVFHTDSNEQIFRRLEALKFDASILSTAPVGEPTAIDNQGRERKVLWTVLAINISFFVIEAVAGAVSNSMGLIADGLDMMADGIVYGLALIAVGGAAARKKNIAQFAGYFQIILAVLGFMEIIRRFIGVEKMPDFQTMIVVAILALIADSFCLYLLQRNGSREAHMQASLIFTSNDIVIKFGVIIAGILVLLLNSGYPDLIIGAIVFAIVLRGAYRILQLAK
jgi:Co/Zn/Cd efflux system component